MTELDGIRDQLRRAFRGDAWHGPSLQELLEGVSARQAMSRPIPDRHTIWELVLHLTAWTDIPRRRMEGDPVADPSVEQDWPPVAGSDEASWQATIQNLHLAHDRLQEALVRFPETRLSETVPGRDHSFFVMLHGVVQHGLYHAGQIAMLKKSKA